MNESENVHEIVIVRRRGDGDHEDHHGGVWKVAFADFMTAMMAFFLVLWIVNSTTKQTRSSLARYFNPIRLSDTTPARKGLNDPREVDFDASSSGSKSIDKLASEAAKPASESESRSAPHSHENMDRKPRMSTSSARGGPDAREEIDDAFPGMNARNRSSSKDKTATKSQGGEGADAPDLKAAIEARADGDLRRDQGDTLSVHETPEGLLINLTDRSDVGTFAVGSSSAEGKLARWLAAIANALKDRSGVLIIRGHTDARPFKGVGYDNWRLSFARAQTAFFGLVQGGLPEQRIERVEAYADRRPINSRTPNARENRRIEILLRRTAP
ncbi:MAG TPA: flagellar motor protein MotB [Rhodoblastus sp.]|nr:flagellar motor protein MotB [Rhodoblastus sp.]